MNNTIAYAVLCESGEVHTLQVDPKLADHNVRDFDAIGGESETDCGAHKIVALCASEERDEQRHVELLAATIISGWYTAVPRGLDDEDATKCISVARKIIRKNRGVTP